MPKSLKQSTWLRAMLFGVLVSALAVTVVVEAAGAATLKTPSGVGNKADLYSLAKTQNSDELDGISTDSTGLLEDRVDTDAEADSGDEAETKIRLIMFALIGVGVLLGLLTVWYWWLTRPQQKVGENIYRREAPSS